MAFTDRKLEISIVGLSIVLVGGLGYLLKAPVQAVLAEAEVSYEMPRPKTSFLAALFDLGDREISRKYVNPFAKKEKKEAKKAAEVAKAPVVPPKAVAKAKKDDKKKDEAAKKKVDVQIVGADTKGGLGEDNLMAPAGKPGQPLESTPEVVDARADKQAKNEISGAQWRALILAQPTKENIAKLVAAYNAKEVDDQTFYTIVTDLYRDNKSENQAMGLMAVKAVYNDKSFAVTAQYYDQFSAEVQASAHTYLLSYGVSSRLPILMSSLQSSNIEVVSTAVEVVLDGYQKAKSGVSPLSDPRTARGDVTMNSVSGYAKFLPVFQKLSQSADPVIAGLANTALGQIQTSVAAL